jgi:hypothetical protein
MKSIKKRIPRPGRTSKKVCTKIHKRTNCRLKGDVECESKAAAKFFFVLEETNFPKFFFSGQSLSWILLLLATFKTDFPGFAASQRTRLFHL